jgi:hypothetical protein
MRIAAAYVLLAVVATLLTVLILGLGLGWD